MGTQPVDRFNAANVSVRVALERRGAERTAERNGPFAMFDSGLPFAAGNGLFADGALHGAAVGFAGVVITHTDSFRCWSV
jgi:hypothetical protein